MFVSLAHGKFMSRSRKTCRSSLDELVKPGVFSFQGTMSVPVNLTHKEGDSFLVHFGKTLMWRGFLGLPWPPALAATSTNIPRPSEEIKWEMKIYSRKMLGSEEVHEFEPRIEPPATRTRQRQRTLSGDDVGQLAQRSRTR